MNDNEEVVLDLRPHWATIFWPVFLMLVIIGLATALNIISDASAARIAAIVAVVVAAIWLLIRWAKWANTNFVVTTDRVVYRSGVIAKHGREIPLERLNDISFHQSIFERVIGAGDLMIESGGERGQQTFSNIPKPSRVQNEIYRQIEAAQGRNLDRMAGRHELSVPEQLDKLDELRQRGVISQAEFDAKKAQLLDRM